MVAKPLYPLYKNIIKPLDRVRYPELRYYYQLPIGMKEINDSKHRGLRFYKEGSGNFFSLKNTNGNRPILIGDHWNEKYTLKKYKMPRIKKEDLLRLKDELEDEEYFEE